MSGLTQAAPAAPEPLDGRATRAGAPEPGAPGTLAAEAAPGGWAGTGGPAPRTYEAALQALAAVRPELVVMTAENRAAIRNLPAVLGPRFIDVGICEQTMIGAAAGLALRGRTPVAHALATFLVMRAFEFIRTDVGIANLPVTLVGAVPGFLSDGNGPTHQALEDVALMRGIPHMQVVCPADEEELIAALPAILDSRAPCYVRHNALPAAVVHTAPFAIGRAELVAPGAEGGVTLLTYGFLLREVAAARQVLEDHGVPVAVLNMRSLQPVDEAAVVAAARSSRLLVTVEDHFQTGGLYSIVAEVMVRHGVLCRLRSISLGARWFKPALLPAVLAHEGFTGPAIAGKVLAELGERALLDQTLVDIPGGRPRPAGWR
ncbi:MAG TPA: transketolase C-terminal domain-containing protein [Thermoanaerobaculia bacterium]|jgi:transketolase|nr:transketolase C-terminal domain-containing protein [Thermoanaerobaculia bacterium]